MTVVRRWIHRAAVVVSLASTGLFAGCTRPEPPAPQKTVETEARFVSIEGRVQVKKAGTLEWIDATLAVTLRAGDLVRTVQKATAQIRFPNGTTFGVRPNSLFRVRSDGLVLEMGRVPRLAFDPPPLCEPLPAESPRMTRDAAADLESAAELLVGASVLKVRRDASGALIWTHAPSNRWFNRSLVRTKINTRIEYLKKFADADGSGFVSTPEGRDLRRRIELAFLVSQFRRPISVRELARLLNEDLTRVIGDLRAYARMRDEAIRDGQSGFPALPLGWLAVTGGVTMADCSLAGPRCPAAHRGREPAERVA